MTKPKNIRPTGIPRRHLKIVGEPGNTQVVEVPPEITITPVPTVEAGLRTYDDTNSLGMLHISIAGQSIFLPCFPTESPDYVRLRINPFFYRCTPEEAEALHQEVVAKQREQEGQKLMASLWKPGMPLPEGMKYH